MPLNAGPLQHESRNDVIDWVNEPTMPISPAFAIGDVTDGGWGVGRGWARDRVRLVVKGRVRSVCLHPTPN